MGLLDMLNENLVLRVRLIVYGILLFFSFFIFIGVAVMKDAVGNNQVTISCPLYCGVSNGVFECGNVSSCNFPMAIAIMFQLLYVLIRLATLVLLLVGKLTSDFILFQNIPELIYVVIDLFTFLLTFIGACILSAGTNSTCGDDFINCDVKPFSEFTSPSSAAQAGAWISTFAWLFVGLVGFLFLMRTGRIPFIGGNAAPATSGAGADPSSPPQDTPPSNIDDPPKY